MFARTSVAVVGLMAVALAPAGAALGTGTSAAVPHCGNADLKARYRYEGSGAGHVWGWIVLRNRTTHSCVTGGFDGLSYVGDGNGTQIGAAAIRVGPRALSYVLQPGQRLRSEVQETDAFNYPRSICRPAHVDGFRVYVPNAYLSQYIVHPTTGCRSTKVELLEIQANVRP